MKIGFFGGTFAPPHNGHVNIVKSAIEQLNPDKLIVMPCGLPPHKSCFVEKDDRIAMARLAFGNIPKVEISLYETNQDGKSYSYLTLKHIKELYPDAELYFVLGGDSLRDFALWKNPAQIAAIATLVVATREDCDITHDIAFVKEFFGARVILLDTPRYDFSSTDIRVNYEFDVDNSLFVPADVDSYIKQHGLFCEHNKLIQKLKNLQEEKRFFHTQNVVKAGLEFAKANGIDSQRAFMACLLHDCGKNISEENWSSYGFYNQEKLLKPIVHCGLGVNVAQQDFGVTDQGILDAIRYHTTGRPNMSPLEKLVFVADKAEKKRKYDVCRYYSAALKNLDTAFLLVLQDMYAIAVKKYGEENVDRLTKDTMNYYKLI